MLFYEARFCSSESKYILYSFRKNYGPVSVFRKLNSKILVLPRCLFGLNDTVILVQCSASLFSVLFRYTTDRRQFDFLCFLNCDLSCFSTVVNEDDRVVTCEPSEMLGPTFIENLYALPKVYSTL